MKDANRWAADHLSVKLRAIGFDGQDLSVFDKVANDTEFLEKLSEMEHRRWMAERLMDGSMDEKETIEKRFMIF